MATSSPPPPYTPLPAPRAAPSAAPVAAPVAETLHKLDSRITHLTQSCRKLRDETADAISTLQTQNAQRHKETTDLYAKYRQPFYWQNKLIGDMRELKEQVGRLEDRVVEVELRGLWVEGEMVEMRKEVKELRNKVGGRK